MSFLNAELPPPPSTRAAALDWLLALALAAASTALFWPVLGNAFLSYDDDRYISREPMVNQGFRSAAIVWTLTRAHSVNWHPLTTFTHMAMCQLFGTDPVAHHAANLVLHAVNAALCFLVFRRLTGRRWPCALVAAVFALHPLRVESVAWAAELKDLLCAFFWFVALWAHAEFAARRERKWYALLAAATACALLAKPMAVTLPFTLLVLDFWPLRRWPARSWWALLREKGWLFLLAAALSVITVFVQLHEGAGDFATRVPMAARCGNATVAGVRYLGKFFWPAELPALYPHPIWWPWLDILASGAVLALLTAAAWRGRRAMPWVLAGWLWFLGTLAPAIGIIQVGVQAMANRYMYLPSLGLTFALVWTLEAWLPRMPRARWIGALCVLAALCVASRRALPPWRNAVALFEHALRVADRPGLIHYWLGEALAEVGRAEEAEKEFRLQLRDDPDYLNGYVQLSGIFSRTGRHEEGVAMLRRAVAQAPWSGDAMNNLGLQLLDEGQYAEAGETLETAARMAPRSSVIQGNLGLYYSRVGQLPRGEQHFREALRLNAWATGNYNDFSVNLSSQGAWREAREVIEKGLWINPRQPSLLRNYGAVLEHLGDAEGGRKARAEAARWQ